MCSERVGVTAPVDPPAELRALGAIALWADGRPVSIGGEKPRRLLAALILHRNAVVSTARLAEALWGDEVPDTAVATLQAYVSRLRGRLPPTVELLTEAPGYRLVVGPRTTDIDRFEAGLAAASSTMADAPADALAHLDDALAEWRGEAFAEFADEQWVLAEVARLTELRLHAREERLGALLALGLDERAAGEAEAVTVEQPWREQPWRALVIALHRVGRQGDALRVASAYRVRLRDDLGLDPSAEFVALERQVATDVPAGAADTSPTRSTVPASSALVELIGRDTDVSNVEDLCRDRRLVTLLGPGGIGKTQLARRAAVGIAAHADVPLEVIELAPVRGEASVVAAAATQLGVQVQQGRSVLESVLDLLATRPLLLLLDNCEHVLDATAALVERLMADCPGVTVLATSREPLGLPHETVYKVPALPVADVEAGIEECAASPAVALFLRRAAAANPDQVVDDAMIRASAELCRRLDGMPLAIELAAARTRALSPTEITERLGDRFGMLSGSSRVADERHRSLRTLVDWSYELLDPTSQRLFRRLTTFAGAFDLDAAERVCGYGEVPRASVATVLASLVDKSMVQAVAGPRTTYRLLETLRDYGAAAGEDEAAELARRHGSWLVEVCERGAIGLLGPDEREWLDAFDLLFDDLRLRVHGAVSAGDVDTALRIVVAAREHAFRRLRYELIGWAETCLAAPDAETRPLAAATLGIVAYGRFVRGEMDAAVELGQRALDLAARDGTDTFGMAGRALGNACFFRGDTQATFAAADRFIDEARASGLDALTAHACYMRSLAETRGGDPGPGLHYAQLAVDAADRSDNPTAHAQAGYAVGVWTISTDPARARHELERSETIAREVGNRWFELFARTETLWLRALEGEPFPALASFADVLSAWHRAGDWANQWLSLRHVFGICSQVGADEVAMIIHGALDRAGAVDAFPFEPAAAADLARAVDEIRARLGDRVVALEQQGRTGTTSAVIGLIVDRIRELGASGLGSSDA